MNTTIFSGTKISQHIKQCILAISLPVALAIIFTVQTLAINNYFGIANGLYTFRLSAISLSLGIFLYSPSILFKKRGQFIYLFLISFFVSFIFISQFLYFSYFGAFLQVSAITYAGLATSVTGTIITLLTPKLYIFLINILLLIITLILTYKKEYAKFLLSKKEKILIFLIVILITITSYWFIFALEKHEWGNTDILYSNPYNLNVLVQKLGIMNFTLEDALKYLLRSNKVNNKDVEFLKQWNQDKATATSTNQYFGIAKNRNVIFIQIESLENIVINQKTGDQEITPNLNKLSREGLYFDNFYAQVGPGNTADTEFSVMNSLYPLSNDVAFINYAHNNYNALPQLLDQNGYSTYALHGDVTTFWNRSNAYPGLGYEKWFGRQDFNISRHIGAFGLGDEEFLNQSIDKIKNFIQPYLVTLITLSSHTPFELPEDLQTLNIPTQNNFDLTQKKYLQSIHYTDKALGEFIDKFKETELYNKSVIVIYGDHQSYTDISSKLANNEPGLENENHVPLIILTPGIDLQKIINTPSSQIDIYPTLVNLLGIIPPNSILGQDILNTNTPVAVHRNAITGTIKNILTSDITYKADANGIYENGECLETPTRKFLPITNCQYLYNKQKNIIKASDTIIRGNLLELVK